MEPRSDRVPPRIVGGELERARLRDRLERRGHARGGVEPHELLRAQFGRFADAYDLTAARTKAVKVRLIGNSVCPEVAEAVIRANFTRSAEAAA